MYPDFKRHLILLSLSSIFNAAQCSSGEYFRYLLLLFKVSPSRYNIRCNLNGRNNCSGKAFRMTFFFTFANNSYFSTPLFRLVERNLYRLQSVEVLLKLIRFTLNTLSLNESFIKGYVWRRFASLQAFTSGTCSESNCST